MALEKTWVIGDNATSKSGEAMLRILDTGPELLLLGKSTSPESTELSCRASVGVCDSIPFLQLQDDDNKV